MKVSSNPVHLFMLILCVYDIVYHITVATSDSHTEGITRQLQTWSIGTAEKRTGAENGDGHKGV